MPAAMTTEARTVARDGAERVVVELRMGSGELIIGGGALELLEAEFGYNVPAWRPELAYAVRAGQGHLTIHQPEHAAGVRNGRQRWTLHLADNLPLALRIWVGAVTAILTQGDLALSGLDIQTGTGTLTLGLAGARVPFDTTIQGGAISADLHLPQTIGAEVALRVPIATVNAAGFRRQGRAYVNAAYTPATPALRIQITGGVANVTLTAAAEQG